MPGVTQAGRPGRPYGHDDVKRELAAILDVHPGRCLWSSEVEIEHTIDLDSGRRRRIDVALFKTGGDDLFNEKYAFEIKTRPDSRAEGQIRDYRSRGFHTVLVVPQHHFEAFVGVPADDLMLYDKFSSNTGFWFGTEPCLGLKKLSDDLDQIAGKRAEDARETVAQLLEGAA